MNFFFLISDIEIDYHINNIFVINIKNVLIIDIDYRDIYVSNISFPLLAYLI